MKTCVCAVLFYSAKTPWTLIKQPGTTITYNTFGHCRVRFCRTTFLQTSVYQWYRSHVCHTTWKATITEKLSKGAFVMQGGSRTLWNITEGTGAQHFNESGQEIHSYELKSRIGPLHDPVTWRGIHYTGTQITQWDFQNKRKSGWTGTSSFVLEVPLRNLRPSVIYSAPCDRIVQRAYYRWFAL